MRNILCSLILLQRNFFMNETVLRIIASVVTSCLLCFAELKLLGALQQSGYQNKNFWRWFRRKDNMFFNRLAVLAFSLALTTALFTLSFSFLGVRWALCLSAIPFWGLIFFFLISDRKYALRVPLKATNRVKRLFAAGLRQILLNGNCV